jgi:hypothetical protein
LPEGRTYYPPAEGRLYIDAYNQALRWLQLKLAVHAARAAGEFARTGKHNLSSMIQARLQVAEVEEATLVFCTERSLYGRLLLPLTAGYLILIRVIGSKIPYQHKSRRGHGVVGDL